MSGIIFADNRRTFNRNIVRKLRVRTPGYVGPPVDHSPEYGDILYLDEDKMYEYLDPVGNTEDLENLHNHKFTLENDFNRVDYQEYDYSELGILDFTRRSY